MLLYFLLSDLTMASLSAYIKKTDCFAENRMSFSLYRLKVVTTILLRFYIIHLQMFVNISHCTIAISHTSGKQKIKKILLNYLDSMPYVSEPLRKDLRHQIWKALLRLGHSVPCLEKHRNHSINRPYCCFKGSVRRA